MRDFGGLKAFVREYLSDAFAWAGRTGHVPGDDIFVRSPTAESHISTWQDVRELPGASFWQSYSNPNIPARFCINETHSVLYMSAPNAALPTVGAEVPKLTESDYRQIAQSFIANLNPEIQRRAHELVAGRAFNAAWVQFLRNDSPTGVFWSWEKFRIEAVYRFLRNSLHDLGCADEMVRATLDHLKRSQDARARPSSAVGSKSAMLKGVGNAWVLSSHPIPTSVRPKATTDSPELEAIRRTRAMQLAIGAIQYMSLEQLRELRLPLGSVLDALD